MTLWFKTNSFLISSATSLSKISYASHSGTYLSSLYGFGVKENITFVVTADIPASISYVRMSSLKDLRQHHKGLKMYRVVALMSATIDLDSTICVPSLATLSPPAKTLQAARRPQKPAQHKQHILHIQQVDNKNNIIMKYIDGVRSSVCSYYCIYLSVLLMEAI
jgi:hypothetical protein